MAPQHSSPKRDVAEEGDDASYGDDRSTSSTSGSDGEDGSVEDGSVSSEGSQYTRDTLDTVGRMLHRLEHNDSKLVDLVINCKTIDVEDAKNISLILPENTRLTRLRLYCGNNASVKVNSSVADNSKHVGICRRVLSGLKGNSSIEHVEIHDLTLDRDTSSWMAPSVLSNSKSLTRLSMTNCRFVGSGLGVLFIVMQQNKQIRHLAFQSCDWDYHNAEIVASALPYLRLHSLSLVDITIAVDFWPYLFKNIKRAKELLLLDLSRNKLDESIIGQLTKTMTLQQNISTLVLSSCSIDDKCNKELAKGLRKYSPLSSLDVSKNDQMSDRGVVYLKDLMKFNSSITELKVNGCGLSTRSLDAIESSLRYNNSVLKGFLSESVSQTIFGVVDMIDQIDLGVALSFGSGEPSSRNPSSFGSGSIPLKAASFGGSGSSPRREAVTLHETSPRREAASSRDDTTPRREGTTPRMTTPRTHEGAAGTVPRKAVNVDKIYGKPRVLRGLSLPGSTSFSERADPTTQTRSSGQQGTSNVTSSGKEEGVRYKMKSKQQNDVYL